MLYTWRPTKAERTKCDRENAAYNALCDLPVTVTDLELALAIAEHRIADAQIGRRGKLKIFHDVRKRTGTTAPLPYDFQDQNMIGIYVKDEARARDWCVKALLLGYAIFVNSGGTALKHWRDRLMTQKQGVS